MNGGNVIFHFKGDKTGLENSINGISSGMKGLTSKIAIGNIAAKAISKTFSLMSSNMDEAISRVDTMNNFPNVMKNLGISADDSQKAIDKMSKKLQGLPTSLDAGARSVQRFTSANGDVKKSTDMFLALNNALLAGGAGAEVQASALEQLSQAYAKGRPDMIEWRSVLTAMPAQATQLGKAFGMTSNELGEALRTGKISMDDFMGKVMELNKKGVAGFDNFETQAKRATGGISTSVTNMKTAIVRGVGNMLNKINESLKSVGGISGALSKVGKFGEQAFTKIGNAIAKVIPIIINITKWFKKNSTLVEILGGTILTLVAGFKALSIIKTVIASFRAFRLAITTVQATAMLCGTSMSSLTAALKLLNLGFLASPIFWIIAGITALVVAIVVLYNKCEWFRNAVNAVVTFVWNLLKGIFNFIKNNWKELALFLVNPFAGAFALLYKNCEGFRNKVNSFVAKVKQIFTNLKNGVVNAFNNMVNNIKSIPGKIASIPEKIRALFKALPKEMLNVGINIVKGLWNGAKDMKDYVVNKFKGLGKSILGGMKKALGIKSPSKEFAIIGRFSMLGYTEGLEQMQPELNKAINGMFNLSPNVTGTMNNRLSPNVNVSVVNNLETDPLGQVVSKIKTFSGGAKNDYNYGYGG